MHALVGNLLGGLNGFAFSGLLIAVTSAVMAVFMFVLARNRANIHWGIFCLAVFMWGLGVYRIGSDLNCDPLKWWMVSYFGVIFIPALFVHFVHVFLGIRRYLLVGACYLISLGYVVANGAKVLFGGIHMVVGLRYISPTPLYTSFVIFFFLAITYAHVLLVQAYRHSEGQRRSQIGFFLMGSMAGFVGGAFSFLPVYNIPVYPYPNASVAFFPVIMGYAAVRYALFNMRVVLAEILTSLVWIFVSFRTVLGWGSAQTPLDIILLGTVVVLGILLVRSVAREVAQREQLQALNTIQARYLSFAAHQVKAPMTAVKGFATLIFDGTYGEVPEKVKEAARRIQGAADRMILTVNNILNTRKIEEGKMDYQFAMGDVGALLADVIQELQPLAVDKGIPIEVHVDSQHASAEIDEQQFRQVLQNLVENAIKYTEIGSIQVGLEGDQDQLTISVADSGQGIARETLPRLFAEFNRGRSPSSISGTGLGLYIAHSVVTAHRGTIWAESRGEGLGSTFFVRIPRYRRVPAPVPVSVPESVL